jgi:hypothetical protein
MFLTNRVHARSENNSARPMDGQERIEIGSAGFGEASNSTLEERARQIAASDGRTEVNDLDHEEARRQLNNPLSDREDADELIAESDRPDAGSPRHRCGGKRKKPLPMTSQLLRRSWFAKGWRKRNSTPGSAQQRTSNRLLRTDNNPHRLRTYL